MSSASRLKQRSLISAYFEAGRLYATHLRRYVPAVALPAGILFLMDVSHVTERWMEAPTGTGLLLVFFNVAVVFLLSGVLGHITSHIYAGGKTGTWETLRSALRLVPAEFAAGLIPALGATILFMMLPGMRDSAGEFRGYGLLLLIAILWAVSIVASLVVESEGVTNPVRAVGRAFQLVFAKERALGNSVRIVGVVFLNYLLIHQLETSPGVMLLVKLSVEPPLEIVFGLLYFNLRFVEGSFDVTVLSQELEKV